jgi:hypothetical protein
MLVNFKNHPCLHENIYQEKTNKWNNHCKLKSGESGEIHKNSNTISKNK